MSSAAHSLNNRIKKLTMLDMVQEEFSSLVWRIKNANLKGKTEQIRVKEWVKKLCCAVSNQMWRKNRNLYAKVLVIMLENGVLESPFNRNPPQGPLATLTSYDIPFEVRNELQKREDQTKSITTALNSTTTIQKPKQPIYKMRCKNQNKMQDRVVKEEGQEIAALIQCLLQDSANFLKSRQMIGEVGPLLEEIESYCCLRRYQM